MEWAEAVLTFDVLQFDKTQSNYFKKTSYKEHVNMSWNSIPSNHSADSLEIQKLHCMRCDVGMQTKNIMLIEWCLTNFSRSISFDIKRLVPLTLDFLVVVSEDLKIQELFL